MQGQAKQLQAEPLKEPKAYKNQAEFLDAFAEAFRLDCGVTFEGEELEEASRNFVSLLQNFV